MNDLTTKELIKKIKKSVSFSESANDISSLMERVGMSESYKEHCNSDNMCSYDCGMYIAKAFDIFGVVPTMKWLPSEILALYR